LEQTRKILYNIRPRLERNYSVRLVDDAIETALEMSPRYQRHLARVLTMRALAAAFQRARHA